MRELIGEVQGVLWASRRRNIRPGPRRGILTRNKTREAGGLLEQDSYPLRGFGGQALQLLSAPPRRRRDTRCQAEQPSLDLEEADLSRGVVLMQPANVVVEHRAALSQPAVQVAWRCGCSVAQDCETLSHLLRDDAPRDVGAMEVQAQVAEARAPKPFEHDVESGALLGDEQHRAAAGGQLGDQVGNGLALAGSRGAADDTALTRQSRRNRLVLGGVGIDDQELLVGG